MTESRTRGSWIWFVAIGLVVGYLSGLFGVGGGILIVPALVTLVHLDLRVAAGTSLAAIVPIVVVGVVSYLVQGAVDWLAAVLLVVGAIAGAQLGSLLLGRIPRRALRWVFIVFILVVIVSLFLVVPTRDASIHVTPLSIAGVVVLGLVTGILSGLLGIGGGVIVVPMLILLFGASDLVAKGTSLAMMVPTAISGTIGNIRRKNVDLPAAAVIGASACTTTALGAATAAAIPPVAGNVLFAILLVVIAVRMTIDAIRRPAS